MPRIIAANEDGSIAIRFYMTVNPATFPELVGSLQGLTRREQNRVVKGLILRGLLANAKEAAAAAALGVPQTNRNPPPAEVGELGSTDWLTAEDMAKAFEFAMGAPANANP
jgi:hypothetical protein